MGHAIHFLERLERLSMPQADVALALYRDSDLVRFMLSCIKLPEGVERVALALEHGPDTPHIIVARDGGFVTCLGKGMSVGDHVVVTRERMDRLSAERADYRSAVERMRDTGHARRIYHRLYRGGPGLSREDIRTLRALYPLSWRELLEPTVELAGKLQEFRSGYRRGFYRRKNSEALERLKVYWQSSWALGHLVALFGTVLRQLFDAQTLHADNMPRMGLACLTATNHSTPMVLRGAWAAARTGHHLLSSYKRTFESSDDYLLIVDSIVALTTMGLRHRRLRGEVRKILARRRNPMFGAANSRISVILPWYEKLLENDDDARLGHRMFGAAMSLKGMDQLSSKDPSFVDKLLEVPEETALGMPALCDTRLLREHQAQLVLPMLLPWVASADIEDLYLPAATLADTDIEFSPDFVLDHLDDHATYMRRFEPVRRADTPSRNQPCSCGSGKKYKRCCGAAA